MTPLKSPTAIITGASDNCAGRNSIDRYCLATGLKATKLDRGSGKVDFSPMDGDAQGPGNRGGPGGSDPL